MPVRMMNFLTHPVPRGRAPSSAMVETQEWKEAMEVIRRELKPQEYMAVEFPEDHPIYQKMKHPVQNLYLRLRDEIKERGLDYSVVVRGNAVYVVSKNGTS